MKYESRDLHTYGGGYCGYCGIFKGRKVAMIGSEFKELIQAYKFEEWLPEFLREFNFNEFLKGLEFFSNPKSGSFCQVPCKEGGGIPNCAVRKCAREKEVEVCFECLNFLAKDS